MAAKGKTGNGYAICRTAITGELTIFAAQRVQKQLLGALDAAQEVEVDLAAVTALDSAGVQLLVAAKREAAARGKVLCFTGHSPAVVDTLDLCDLSSFLGDPVLLPRNQEVAP